jgi:transcription antitermination factor NusG
MSEWYALWTKSRHEFKAEEALLNKGFEVFLPTIVKQSIRKDRKKYYKAPLFPGYIFIKTDLYTDIYIDIVRTHGIVNVLGWKEKKAPSIPEKQIESLKILVDRNIPLENHPFLKVGSYVKVIKGPLKGVIGIIKSIKNKRRLIVQVDLLKRAISCEISADDVIPIESPY